MSEALRKVTQQLGLSENKGNRDLNTNEDTLEKALKDEEAELAREMKLGRAEEVIVKRQVRIQQLRGLLGKGGAPMTEEESAAEEKRKADEELKGKMERIAQAKALYTSCIDAGGQPKQCADMVAGLIPSPAAIAAAPQATSITELITALKTLDELRGDRGGELKEVLEKLTAQVQALGNRPPADPIAMAQQQAQAISTTYEALKNLGIIKEPVTTTAEGKSLDVVKEENRHAERMEEVKAESKYKEKLGDTVANLPERIGRGIGGQIIEGEETSKGGGGGGGLDYFTCTEEGCGAKVPITPGVAEATCPKCKAIYARTGTIETQQE